ncbi:hypothetical protein PENSPDRAFT_738210 [Peniophora sp. CONT]|nr:hypothetical protein PENSPDRAFT_738210 [Peniophora sp. CONT]
MSDSSTTLIDFLSDVGPKRLREVEGQVLLAHPSSATSYLASQLDRETSLLDNLSRGLKSRRNECCRLLRLPPEILGEILAIVSANDPPHSARVLNSHGLRRTENKKEDAAHLGWITLGHVCRRLREQLLSLRALWAAIAFSLPFINTAKEIHRRAGDVPLVISLNDGYHTPTTIAELAQKHFKDARIITIGDTVSQLSSFFWNISPKDLQHHSFPFLEELTLKMLERSGPTQVHMKPELYTFPPINAPRLRRLTLQDYFVPCIPENLTSFELFYLSHPSDDALPTSTQFWDLLNGLSNLRRLSLEACIPEITLTANEPAAAVQFMHLEELRIADTIDRARALWSHIRIPSTVDIEFRLGATWGRVPGSPGPEDLTIHETSLFRFITALAPHVRAATATRPIHGLGVYDDFQDGDGARFVLATHSPGAHFQDECGPFARDTVFMLSMSLSSPASTYVHIDMIDMLHRVITDYSLDAIEVFEIINSRSYEESRVIEILQSLSTVHTLVMDAFPDLTQVLGIWNVFFFPGSPDDPHPLVLPNLHTLWVLEVTYLKEDAEEEDLAQAESDELEPAGPTPWSQLLDGLAFRSARNARLQRFVAASWSTDEPDASKKMIARLQEHVDSVEVTFIPPPRRSTGGGPYFLNHPGAMLNGLNLPLPGGQHLPFPMPFGF